MNVSIENARTLLFLCAEKFDIAGKKSCMDFVLSIAIDIYKNLARADECKLSDAVEREERQRFQREAIVGCRVLAGLLDSLCDEEAKKSLCERTAEVRRLSAAWLNAEKRQAVQKGAGR